MADRPDDSPSRSDGLVPAIVQQASDGTVLMLAEMNPEALRLTLQTGVAHFWNRSHQQVVQQEDDGSGDGLRVVTVKSSGDGAALLIAVQPVTSPGESSEFSQLLSLDRSIPPEVLPPVTPPVTEMLGAVYDLILRRRDGEDTTSYVHSLFQRGQDVMCKKVGEEAAEVIIASKNQVDDEVVYEMADLWFHATVLLGYHNIHPNEVLRELQRRFGQPGGGKVMPAEAPSASTPPTP